MKSPYDTGEKEFSYSSRTNLLAGVEDDVYDLIVVGGGITGAGILLDATLRGLKTLLVEQHDFASGTSSKSTKLIHGGLRYLKQFEFGLVRESGRERGVVHANIPHLVHPQRMFLPIVRGGTFGKWTASLAISLYGFLAKVARTDARKNYSKSATLNKIPLLNESILQSSVSYAEYRTDDARLTVELIKAAIREGGHALNYGEVTGFLYDQGSIAGIKVEDALTKNRYKIRALNVVSASGPWADELRKKDNAKTVNTIKHTKGVHIVVPKEKLPLEYPVYFDVFDGRMIFAIPRGRTCYIGTTDTFYNGPPGQERCTFEDARYLVEATNRMFPSPGIEMNDIESSWAGLRALIYEDGKSASEISRKDEIFESASGLITIAGGKLTGYRKMAKRAVDLVTGRFHNGKYGECRTKTYKIHANPFKNYHAYLEFRDACISRYRNTIPDIEIISELVANYGRSASRIIEQALSQPGGDLVGNVIRAEVAYCIQYESAIMPDDYFNRRSGRLFFNIPSLKVHFDIIHECFAQLYNWDENKIHEMKSRSMRLIEACTDFRKIH